MCKIKYRILFFTQCHRKRIDHFLPVNLDIHEGQTTGKE